MSNTTMKAFTKNAIRALLALIVIVIVCAQIIIAPQLVTYQSGDQNITSIYWHGLDGRGHLTDTEESFVRLDNATNNLHLCYSFEEVENCQEFNVVETQGTFAVLKRLFNQYV